jgi:hypothetical protein
MFFKAPDNEPEDEDDECPKCGMIRPCPLDGCGHWLSQTEKITLDGRQPIGHNSLHWPLLPTRAVPGLGCRSLFKFPLPGRTRQ